MSVPESMLPLVAPATIQGASTQPIRGPDRQSIRKLDLQETNEILRSTIDWCEPRPDPYIWDNKALGWCLSTEMSAKSARWRLPRHLCFGDVQ